MNWVKNNCLTGVADMRRLFVDVEKDWKLHINDHSSLVGIPVTFLNGLSDESDIT